MPFLENVLRGRRVPPERMQQVAAHYLEFGGVSPINGQNRALVEAVARRPRRRGRSDLPVYWGNRNWHPYLADTVRAMAADGVRRAAAFVTSAYSSYSSCRQYLDDLARARADGRDRARPSSSSCGPISTIPASSSRSRTGCEPARAEAGPDAPVLMSAHSIPAAMAATCDYERQLRETARLVAERPASRATGWSLVFQSRSGPPQQPWLGPDINDAIAALPGASAR